MRASAAIRVCARTLSSNVLMPYLLFFHTLFSLIFISELSLTKRNGCIPRITFGIQIFSLLELHIQSCCFCFPYLNTVFFSTFPLSFCLCFHPAFLSFFCGENCSLQLQSARVEKIGFKSSLVDFGVWNRSRYSTARLVVGEA